MQDENEHRRPSSTSDLNELASMYTRMKDDICRIQLELSTSRGRAVDEGRSNPPGLKRTVILIDIDEDGAVFNLDLIANGIIGGRDAGFQLATGVRQYLRNQEGRQLWAYVFLNKHRLTDALRSSSKPLAARTLSDFMVGFSQANQRFMIVDVGGEKDAAYAKITALIEDEICLPQTEKIIFAGTDVGGYKTIFRTHITSGYKDKLVLLKTYDEDADRFAELDLPIFPIKNLFNLDKLTVPEKFVTTTPGVLAVEIPNSQTPPGSPEEWTTVNRRKGRGRGSSLAGTPVLGLTVPTNVPSSPEIKVQLPGTPGFGAGQNLVRQEMHTPDEKTQEDDLAELRLKTLPNPHVSAAN
ncbi:hypothetical protein H1R20_g10299, partial [Candolleomyces eurysporus]